MVMSFLGGLASGALGLVGTLFGSKQQQSYNVQNMASQNKYNTQEMKYANDLNKQLAKYNQELTLDNLYNTPYALRQGMERAGFNPTLAYSSGNFTNATSPGSQSALGSSLPSNSLPDYAGQITNAMNTGFQIQQQLNANAMNIAQVKNVNADSELKEMQSSTEAAKIMQAGFQNELLSAQTELARLDSQLKHKEIDWYDYKQMREDIFKDIKWYDAQSKRIESLAALQNSETNATWTPYKVGAGMLTGVLGGIGLGRFGKAGKAIKGSSSKLIKSLGKNGFKSSSAKYFTTLH